MLVIPAIDLRDGRVVRLQQGDYGRETVFGDDPVAQARQWAELGAPRLHLVDLDGAKTGDPVNFDVVRRIVDTLPIPCQLGGGVRDEDTVRRWLDCGVQHVIVGTFAVEHPDRFAALVRDHPGRVVLGIDARDGKVATRGWLDVSAVDALELALRADELPLAGIVHTDIARDGMLRGPNVQATAEIAARVRHPVTASGGVSSLQDLRKLAATPVAACIVGRALYDRRFTYPQALHAARNPESESETETETRDEHDRDPDPRTLSSSS